MVRALLMCLAFAASSAFAGPEWPEGGDAGSLPGSAQPIGSGGGGMVTKIIGELSGPPGLPDTGLGDFQDMYLIFICDPMNFLASTSPDNNGAANFNASLWLFSLDGRGLLANQDAGPGDTHATLLPDSNDGTGVLLVDPGLYYLAISGAGSVPTSSPGDQRIFSFGLPGEVSGPDGPGGSNPITGWDQPGEYGQYEIALHGVCFIVPAPASVSLLASVALLGFGRTRRL